MVKSNGHAAGRKEVSAIGVIAVLLVFLLGIAAPVSGQQASQESGPGTAITAGYGYEYSGYGVAIEWYFHDEGPDFGVFAGIGYFPPVSILGVTTDGTIGGGVGVRTARGREHRFIADLQYGFAGQAVRETTTFTGTTRETATLLAPTAAIGYQLLRRGLILNATIGVTWLYGADPWVIELMGEYLPTLNLGIGYKIR